MVSELERYISERSWRTPWKDIKEIYKKSGDSGSIFKDCLLLLFLAVVMVVFFVSMLESNLERITKQIMRMRIKENSIPHCRASPLARVPMKNFHLN